MPPRPFFTLTDRRNRSNKRPDTFLQRADNSMDDIKCRNITNKRQRRLTNQQGIPTEMNFIKDMSAKFNATKPYNLRQVEKRDQEEALALSGARDDTIAYDDDRCTSGRLAHMCSSPSAKIAPGKRIMWRNAIDENDLVRRDLHSLFVQVDGPVGLRVNNFHQTA